MKKEGYVVECRKLGKKFGSFEALKDIDLCLERGKIIGLLGPNGSGKTTLIKLINGLLVPTSGQVLVNGMAPCPETKARVSYLPDNNYLSTWMNVSQMIDYYGDFYSDFDKAKAYEMLKSLGLEAKQRFKTMSKGMKEKVQLILVMSRNADLYCLDEPIGGVDPATREYILRTIITNYAEDATVLISTHLIADVEKVLDEAIFIQKGSVLRHSSVEEIRNTYGQSVDALFREEFKC
ncbi:MAG: ABC transporter ATP-binding protein [Lachnospiraceae bacterium]|nr:ABC transporter ATP-binding protein [Lachnospiraceae bacterium]